MHTILTPCHGTHSIQSNRTTIQPTYKSEYQQPHTPDPVQKINTQILSVTIPVHSKRSFANTKVDTFTWPSLPPTPLHLSDFPRSVMSCTEYSHTAMAPIPSNRIVPPSSRHTKANTNNQPHTHTHTHTHTGTKNQHTTTVSHLSAGTSNFTHRHSHLKITHSTVSRYGARCYRCTAFLI